VLRVTVGDLLFRAQFEADAAPATVAAVRAMLPLSSQIIHARWSGEACWIPFGDLDLGVKAENATCYPAPGQLLLYPGGVSETELLFPYGPTSFASKAGALAGNHFASVLEGAENFAELGRRTLWTGAQAIEILEEDES
jgi:hypothetical protein